MDHELMTHMLFVDAIVGVGFPHHQVGVDAERGGLATDWSHLAGGGFRWVRTALEALDVNTLQELYTALKLHEVTHAS